MFCEPDWTSWIVTPSTTMSCGSWTIEPPRDGTVFWSVRAQASKPPISPPTIVTFDARMNADRPRKLRMRTSSSDGLHSLLQTSRFPRALPVPEATMSWMWKWLALIDSPVTVGCAPGNGRNVTADVFDDCAIDWFE